MIYSNSSTCQFVLLWLSQRVASVFWAQQKMILFYYIRLLPKQISNISGFTFGTETPPVILLIDLFSIRDSRQTLISSHIREYQLSPCNVRKTVTLDWFRFLCRFFCFITVNSTMVVLKLNVCQDYKLNLSSFYGWYVMLLDTDATHWWILGRTGQQLWNTSRISS